jgi:hypothetical protein
MSEMRRRGEKTKCPACGCGLDEDAYRCPKCRIYFCYKCRARVGRKEEQYQCADQSCSCYGKLLCSACTVMVPHEGPVTSTKRFFRPKRLTMTRYGPERARAVGVSDITRRRLSNQGKRCWSLFNLSITGTSSS